MARNELLQIPVESSCNNPLAEIIEQKIQQKGSVPFDTFMSAWLYGAKNENGKIVSGYYNDGNCVIADSFNSTRFKENDIDFYTYPETTPMYGYVLADQINQMWESLGKPEDFRVVEMGAGNGTMANDILHRLHEVSEENNIMENMRYIVVEQSPSLLSNQNKNLEKFSDSVDFVNGLANELPLRGITGVVISNELPDAFPMKRARVIDGKLEECFIGKGEGATFAEIWKEPSLAVKNYVDSYGAVHDGTPFPVNIEAEKWIRQVAQALDRGFVITMDYPLGNLFPVLFGRKPDLDQGNPNSFLEKKHIGKVDITGGVDFQMLSDTGRANGLKTEGYVNNTGFLYGLGIDIILGKLQDKCIDKFAGRKLEMISVARVMKNEKSNVLIQSKGVNLDTQFSSLEHIYSRARANRGKFQNIRY